LAKRLKIKDEQLINIYENYGNQVGASLPTALHIGISTHRIQRGEKILLIGTGAGLTIGGMILEY
jgi:3-oxoacyl-[acyl-carrier-protein] synthase III